MNIPEMKKYAEKLMEFVSEPSLLLLDMASSHTSKQVVEEIQLYTFDDGTQAVTVKHLGPKTAFLVSPLDNGAIAEFKQYFHKFDRRTLPMKKMAAVNAWKKVSNENLRSYVAHCGWFTDESLSTIRTRFMKDVRCGIPKNFEKIWDFYDGWQSGSFDVHGISAIRGVHLEKPQQLDDGFLDGRYWTAFGSIVK